MIKIIFIALLSVAFGICGDVHADLIIHEHCHKEQTITKDKDDNYVVSSTGETVCESSPNDWKEN